VYTGGLVGNNNSATCTNSFWDTQTSNQSTSACGTGKLTYQMKTRSTFTNAGWDFINATGYSDHWGIDGINNSGYPFLTWVNQCWTGEAKSSDWFTASNWHSGTVPTSDDTVSIAYTTNNPSIGGSTTATCISLAIATGSSVTIEKDGKLSISYKLVNNGNCTIESDATGTGSLITGHSVSGTGTFDAQRYIVNEMAGTC